jgi:hypothetical protein
MSAELLRRCECGCGATTGLAKATDSRRGYIKGRPLRFVKGHGGGRKLTSADRFWRFVDRSADTMCWHWKGNVRRSGYGRFDNAPAHRFAYELLIGPIPLGLQLDHLCRNTGCVNPQHLEPVTGTENLRRQGAAKSACPQGHPYTPENTYLRKVVGHRQCRTCLRARARAAYWARREADVSDAA